MNIIINSKNYEAEEGELIHEVAKRNGIEIPTLCSSKKHQDGVCRICVVEIGGKLVTSCNTKVKDGLEIITESEKVSEARRINLELLWSDHAGKCVKCVKNRSCELQNLAEKYKIENFHFVPRKGEMTTGEELDLVRDNWSRVVVDDQNPAIMRTTEYCVECRRCINICPDKSYGFNHRAGDTVVGTPYEKTLDCLFCGACVKHCPTAALTDKNNLSEIEKKISDINVLAVAILDPAIMESIENELPGISNLEKLAGLLRALGFEKLFSLNWGLDMYVTKLAEELQGEKAGQVILNSHCPAFTRYIKKYYPEMNKNISKIPIPDEIIAHYLKNDYAQREKINPQSIFVVAISSCVAKKSFKYANLDAILTVREMGHLVRKNAIDLKKIQFSNLDELVSGDFQKGEKMVKSGGALELVLEKTSKKKYKTLAVNSMVDIKNILNDIKNKKGQYDLVEGMICPGGCINGGGQSIKLKI